MARRTHNEFGSSVSRALAEVGMTQTELANQTDKPVSYVNQTMTGLRPAKPQWVDIVASTLKLQADRTAELHRAAAKDAGFKIDLDLTKE